MSTLFDISKTFAPVCARTLLRADLQRRELLAQLLRFIFRGLNNRFKNRVTVYEAGFRQDISYSDRFDP